MKRDEPPLLHVESFRAQRRVAGIVFELGLTAILIAAWLLAPPGTGYTDNSDVVFAVALFVCFFSGWHLLGGWGCIAGCAVQLLRFGAFAVLFLLALSAYNPHMDNGCLSSGDYSTNFDQCVRDAQRHFKWTYFALSAVTAASALSLVVYVARSRSLDR